MIYGSVCSGIEAATVAWHSLGWKPAFFSEIEKFPREVLSHHYPEVPLHGDFTTIGENDYGSIDLLVGGTPCQSFSIAGLRKGLDDDRGNLALEFLKLAQRKRPTWLVWENVPGVLSSNGGRDFGSFLGGLVECGYGFAYRVLDAQHFGVPQRRRRVFVVGYLGDWRPAAAVLFERESMSGNPAPSREKRKDVTETAGTLTANCGGLNRPAGNANELDFCSVGNNLDVAPCLDAMMDHKFGSNQWVDSGQYVLCMADGQAQANVDINLAPTLNASHEQPYITYSAGAIGDFRQDDIATTLTRNSGAGGETQNAAFVVHGTQEPIALVGNTIGRKPENGGNGNGFDESGVMYTLTSTDRHAVAYSFDSLSSNSMKSNNPHSGCHETDVAKCLDTTYPCPSKNQGGNAILQQNINVKDKTPDAVAFTQCDAGRDATENLSMTLRSGGDGGYPNHSVAYNMQVRRLTPKECERLQGFPDGYTDIKDKTPDGPRYKALGNSMAVPVMYWIGQRIQQVEDIL